MLTYKNLYCALVRSMSEAIDLYDEGKGILARETSVSYTHLTLPTKLEV